MEAPSLRARVAARIGRLRLDAGLETGRGTLALVGPNGSGKTSLLSLLLGVLPVERGRVEVGGAVLLDTEAGVDVPVEERGIGYVPQDYALFPHLSVRENVAFAVRSAASRRSVVDRAERVDAMLHELGIAALAHRRTQALSGGEKQRVALARALSVGPRALLLDEPLAALDVHSRREVRAFLADYLRALALPTIVVTHDAADARLLAHRVAVLEAGRVTQAGTWEELAARPASRFVEELVASARGGGE
ncbi:ABC transporter ATP-binding protein [Sorangium cellulosum]|uniref:Molybdenum ABC transporter ATP-binding protein n=1 Tax=Sorangium cellulosum TaxID=56 RepID=A0A150QQL4_SORCE|nr:ATP-binding cassette domain-containing protein [Sorangium cellulosum]KYF69898.1 molybdenum ABC transporter ATP-binding protein [Sorangium cellulosum]